MGQHHRDPTGGWTVPVTALLVTMAALAGCSAGSTADPPPASSARPAPTAPTTPTTCRDISDVMTLLVDVGQQLARDQAAGTATGVQEADYARLLEQSANRIEDLSTAPADPAELQQVAVLFDTVFGFGLENPASEGPFNAAAAAFETSCGYALFS